MKTNFFFFILFLLLVFSGCIEQGHLKVNIVVQHVSSQPDGLHPFNNNSSVRSFIFNYTQKTLIKLDMESLEYIPVLIDSLPEISEDGLAYTYKIRKGIKWDDGTLFTSRDVAFSTKLMLCPLTDNTQIRSNYNTVIKSIQTYPEDAYKFTMHAKKLHVSNKDIFSELYMQQEQRWDQEGLLNNLSFEDIYNENWEASELIQDWFVQFNHADNSYATNNLTGLGSYQVTEFKTGQYITLEKKKDWWGENDTLIYNISRPDKIIFRIITDDAAVYFALKNERIDATTYISTKKFLDLRNDDKFNQNYHSDFIDRFAFNYIGLNTKPDGINHKQFFIDKRVRRAMAYLTPVDKIIQVMVYGHAIRQTSNISPLKSSYNDTLKEIPLDIEKAKILLDEAGWIDTDGDNIRDKIIDGIKTPFTFNFSYMSSATSTQVVLMIQESMKQAGVNAIPSPMDFSLFYERAQNHEFDAMLGGWGGSASYSDPMQLWHTSSWVTKGSNFCGFGDAESDALIEEANTSIDPKKHKEALWKLQAKIYEEQPYVFLYSSKNKIAIHKRFDNANMYRERPGVILNNLLLIDSRAQIPTNGL